MLQKMQSKTIFLSGKREKNHQSLSDQKAEAFWAVGDSCTNKPGWGADSAPTEGVILPQKSMNFFQIKLK